MRRVALDGDGDVPPPRGPDIDRAALAGPNRLASVDSLGLERHTILRQPSVQLIPILGSQPATRVSVAVPIAAIAKLPEKSQRRCLARPLRVLSPM
jgi:hypothetical protein